MSKNENEYLKENIQYHTKLGVDYFYIYDNNSTKPLALDLKEFNNVKVIPWVSVTRGSQCRAYNDCINKYGNNNHWIGFIDTDEFLVLKKKNCLKDFLKNYERYGGVGINWKCFGSSGHTKKQKSVIESYTYAKEVSDNCHIKSIVQPKCVIRSLDPHSFAYHKDKFCVNEKEIKLANGILPDGKATSNGAFNHNITYDYIQLNHYITRSREDFEHKKKRGGGNAREKRISTLTEDFWNKFQGGKQDLSLHKLLHRIK
tara:strand:- start:149 stop:922 length:774 start_codon:yes stop_codon:yes gene_type:complete